MPLSDAGYEPTDYLAAPLVAAGRLLADRGVYGLVWIDPDMIVRSRYGALVDFIDIGEDVRDSVLPLLGLDKELARLQQDTHASLNLPAVTINNGTLSTPRLNLLVLWAADQRAYLLMVSRAVTKADLEVELSRHIRARLMAEAEVKRKSVELANANRDLEEYAAVISHDLKAPLRAMRYLAGDLEEALAAGNEPEARVTLARLKEQSTRMSGMLSALLDYSSIGRKDEAVARVDTHALVTSIVRSIPHPPGIALEIDGHWPVIDTLGAPLDLIVRNLIGNAIVHHDRETGRVRVSAIDSDLMLDISVSDDGPGIAPAHHAAIFLPFRTLGDTSRTGGQGMGLSLVKRTVESVGGRIEVHSNPEVERGTTFRIVWPKRW
ncbi:MAG: sensor histidine kinase [Hyphomicrobium sp.]